MTILFRLCLAIDAMVAGVAVYFFFIGLSDGSVSSFNIVMWLVLLGGIAAILGAGWFLNAKAQRGAAVAVLSVLALPGFLAALFLLLVLLLQPRWN